MLIKRSHLLAITAVMLTLGMAGCGGGSDSAIGASTGNNSVQASDSFFSSVMAMMNASTENTEPGATDPIAVTTPDNTEPIATN